MSLSVMSDNFSLVNRHVRDKIRQQLQVLRDAKLLVHVGSGVWRLPGEESQRNRLMG